MIFRNWLHYWSDIERRSRIRECELRKGFHKDFDYVKKTERFKAGFTDAYGKEYEEVIHAYEHSNAILGVSVEVLNHVQGRDVYRQPVTMDSLDDIALQHAKCKGIAGMITGAILGWGMKLQIEGKGFGSAPSEEAPQSAKSPSKTSGPKATSTSPKTPIIEEVPPNKVVSPKAGTPVGEGAVDPAKPVGKPIAENVKTPILITSATASEELGSLGKLNSMSKAEIQKTLSERGYTSVPAKGGGEVWTKNLPDGNTAAVRVDPAMQRVKPKGFADEVPHAHKEIVPTSSVDGGNYKPSEVSSRLDDLGNPSTNKADQHIPIER